MSKTFIETVLSIHERIQKSRALGTKKQVPSSSICKYNLLRKVDTLKVDTQIWLEAEASVQSLLQKEDFGQSS